MTAVLGYIKTVRGQYMYVYNTARPISDTFIAFKWYYYKVHCSALHPTISLSTVSAVISSTSTAK